MFHINPALAWDPAAGDAFVFWNEEPPAQNMWGLFGQRISAAGALHTKRPAGLDHCQNTDQTLDNPILLRDLPRQGLFRLPRSPRHR